MFGYVVRCVGRGYGRDFGGIVSKLMLLLLSSESLGGLLVLVFKVEFFTFA